MRTGDEFSESAFRKASKLYIVERIGSFVYDVARCNGKGKTHRVHTDVVLYAQDGEPLASSFAYCTCSEGMACTDRVCLCPHVLAVYMGIDEEGDVYDGEEEADAGDHSGGGADADLGRPGKGLRHPEQ